MLLIAVAIAALAVLAGVQPSEVAGGGAQASASSPDMNVRRVAAAYPPAHPPLLDQTSPAAPASGGKCPLVERTARTYGYYVNPLAHAHVTPERIDMGVDYAGSGTLVAIGDAKVTYVASPASGWPGAFIEYRLLAGPDSGCYVYYAEGVTPAAGLHVGQGVSEGQPLASIIRWYSSGIEIGWGGGKGTTTFASRAHQWSLHDDANNIPSPAGRSFSALIAALGGPPGKVEGRAGSG